MLSGPATESPALGTMAMAVIGLGPVGRSLCEALAACGLRVVAVASRQAASAEEGARLTGCRFCSTDNADAARAAELIFLCVPDDQITLACEGLAAADVVGARKVVVHLSGSLGSSALISAREKGADVLAFHPIQTFSQPSGDRFRGIYFGMAGTDRACALGAELAEALGSTAIVVPEDRRAAYHCALAIACNYVVGLIDVARRILADLGFGEGALPALLPLLEGTLCNLREAGLPQALTGPISRGDYGTIERHLCTLRESYPELVPLYARLGTETLDLALAKGRIRDDQASRLRVLLESP